MMRTEEYPDLRRNALFLGLDYVFFGIGMALLNNTTVLPTLARRLTDSTVLVGLISTISTGGWLLPQIFAANLVAGRERMKPYVIWPGLIGRLTLWITGISLLLLAKANPDLALTIFFVSYLLFWLSDGMASVPWFDLLARAIPPTRRGRLIGAAQAVNGLLSIGIGLLVSYLLGAQSPVGFPANYSLLIFGAALSMMLSLAAIALIREPTGRVSSDKISWTSYFPRLWKILRGDLSFVRLMSTRLLIGFSTMAYTFYILFATEKLNLTSAVVGYFTATQTIGGILGGFVLGYFNERKGSVSVVRITVITSFVIPMLVLVIHLTAGFLGSMLIYIYAIVFTLIGVVNSSFMLGFISCLMEIAPSIERPMYVGLANTINSLILVAPLIGGWILQVGTYPLLFVVSALCAALAFIPAWALVEPRTQVIESVGQ